jgi:hypothetical protein
MFRILIFGIIILFGYAYLHIKGNNTPLRYPTDISYFKPSEEILSASFPFNFFSGYILFLKNSSYNENANATAFSINSSKGIWMTASHAVEDCWGVLIDKNGKDWVFIDEVILHPNADVALLKTPLSAPSIPVLSKRSWVPSKSYFLGYSQSKINIGTANLKGWTKAIDEKDNYAFDVFIWEPNVLLDYNRTFGMSGGPVLDMEGNVIGVIVAHDQNQYFASVPPYFLEDIIKEKSMSVKHKEVSTIKEFNLEFISSTASDFEANGTLKKIRCIRNPDDYLMQYNK